MSKRLIFVTMDFEALVKHISTIQNTLQAQAAHAVNHALTSRNWLMGCYIGLKPKFRCIDFAESVKFAE